MNTLRGRTHVTGDPQKIRWTHPGWHCLPRRVLSAGVSALAGFLVLFGAPAFAGGTCTKTAQAASTACRGEAQDDFWIATGNCLNLADTGEAKACIADARIEKQDARDECGEQMIARKDLCGVLGEDPYDPVIDPADFLDAAGIAANPNPYFPLVPGTIYTYEGAGEFITVTVTSETRVILGVETIVIRDTVLENGEVVEDTEDYYGQDIFGNVWYFGEISQGFEDGYLASLEGSWTAGVDGARPGIIMQAMPYVGQVYRQEFFLGDAEDIGEIASLTGSESVPAASCSGNCIVTQDYTPIEPDVVEDKYYAPGVGQILEITEDGERIELTSLITP